MRAAEGVMKLRVKSRPSFLKLSHSRKVEPC
jgi:hypothetical protein